MNEREKVLTGVREKIDNGFEAMRDRIIAYIREKAGNTFTGLEDIMRQALTEEAALADASTGAAIPAASLHQASPVTPPVTQNPPPSAPQNPTSPNTMQSTSSGGNGSGGSTTGNSKWYEKIMPEFLAHEVRSTLSDLKKTDPNGFALKIECLAIVLGHEKFQNTREQLGPGIVGGKVPQFTATTGLARGNQRNITEAIIDMCVNERRVYPDKSTRPVAKMVEDLLNKAEEICITGIPTGGSQYTGGYGAQQKIGGYCADEKTRKRFLQEIIGQDGQRIVVDLRKEKKQAAKNTPKKISDDVKNAIGMVLGADLVDGRMDTFTAIKEAGNRILNGKKKPGVKKPNLRKRYGPPQ